MLLEAAGFFVTCWSESQFENEVLNICGGNDKQADSVLKILQPVIRCSFKSFNAYIEGTPEDRKKANKEYHWQPQMLQMHLKTSLRSSTM